MEGGSIFSVTPSFSSYSSTRFAEIAAKVSEEFYEQRDELGLEDDFVKKIQLQDQVVVEEEEQLHIPSVPLQVPLLSNQNQCKEEDEEEEEENDSDFEFAILTKDDPSASPISADEIFSNGQITPIYPVFNRDLLFAGGENEFKNLQNRTIRIPLRKLLGEERDPTSTSSSEADELEHLPEGTYCVWTPKRVQNSPERCKKSNSTGSSKRWRLRNLLNRSNSDGKDTFVFLTPASTKKKDSGEVLKRRDSGAGKERRDSGASASASPHEAHYVRNRAMKESDRRRSYLPYRQDLVGLFANVSGLNRTLRPF